MLGEHELTTTRPTGAGLAELAQHRRADSDDDRLAQLLSVSIDTAELAEAEESYAEQVTEAVSTDDETAAYVAELERRTDEFDLEVRDVTPAKPGKDLTLTIDAQIQDLIDRLSEFGERVVAPSKV